MLKKLAPAPLSLNVLVVDDERELRDVITGTALVLIVFSALAGWKFFSGS